MKSVGKLFLILGPSGSGKGVMIAYLKKKFKNAFFPVSCTTRTARPAEKKGDVYYYLAKKEFKRKIKADEFLEWAVVHRNNFYGTLKKPILDGLKKGKIVIREVDMQGVKSIKKILPRSQVAAVFLTAPSWKVLKNRILRRHKESKAEIARRKKSFYREMRFSKKCDYIVKSEDGKLNKAFSAITNIIKKEMKKHSGVV